MPNFKYEAKSGPHEKVQGLVEAENRERAIDIINTMGLIPVKVELASEAEDYSVSHQEISVPAKKVRLRDLVILSGQLSRLIHAGVPILRALRIISEQTSNKYLKYVISQIAADIKSGSTFSGAISRFPSVFPAIYVAIIKTGEDSGSLGVSLGRTSEYFKKQDEAISKIKVALIYPGFMAFVGLATVIFMLIFVIPKISGIYTSVGQELPLVTRSLIVMSGFLIKYWVWLCVSLLVLIFLIRQLADKNKELVSFLKLKFPIYGNFILKTELAKFTASMELTLRNGINLLRAIELALPVMSNEILKKDILKSYEQVKQGESFGKNLKSSKIFPVLVSNLIIVGEESGKLDDMFGEISSYFEKDTEETVKIFTSQFEPAMILVIGLILGYIVIAMLLPIFQLNLIATT